MNKVKKIISTYTKTIFRKKINECVRNPVLAMSLLVSSFVYSQPYPTRTIPTLTNTNQNTTFAAGNYIDVNAAGYTQSSYTISQLINDVLINGGANCTSNLASNVQVSPNLAASNNNRSWGYFNAGTTAFPFSSGIILSTGYARHAGNSQVITALGDNLGTLGDADLASAIGVNNSNLRNASYIEFDFVPISNTITFNYLLASEEYNQQYECNYTDAFALLLKKVGDPNYTNLAVLPNNGGLVSTSNIHPAVNNVFGGCPAVNASYFYGYNTNNLQTNFDGRTIPLTATATVIPGETYHFKMVLADYSDVLYDTAVFLEAGSFDIGVKITDEAGVNLPNSVKFCNTNQTLSANVQVANATFKWYFNNVLIQGATSSTYIATQPGLYKVEVMIPSSTCISTAEITLVSGTRPQVDITDSANNVLPQIYDACNTVNTILKANTSASNVTYQWYYNNVAISGATNLSYTATQVGNYKVKVLSSGYDCEGEDEITINVVTSPNVSNVTIDGCSPTANAIFDLTSKNSSIYNNPQATFLYYESLVDAQAKNGNTINTPLAYSSISKNIYAVVTIGNCDVISTITLNAILAPLITTQPVDTTICLSGNTTLSINALNTNSYQWQIDRGNGFIDLVNDTNHSGVNSNTLNLSNIPFNFNGYKYRVVLTGNCLPIVTSSIASLKVNNLIVSNTQSNVSCNGGNNGKVVLNVSGGTSPYSYLWSNGQTTSTLSNVSIGTYSVTITDAIGCVTTQSFTITQPTVLNLSYVKTDISCNGGSNGSVSLTVNGGTAPYTYKWSSGQITSNITNLSVGSYNVEVTDSNGCVKNETFTITEPLVLDASIQKTDVSCNGGTNGTIVLTVTGGTAPYTYNWSNNKTSKDNINVGVGTYTVDITDAKGCKTTKSIIINEPVILDAYFTQTKAGCGGSLSNTVTVNVTGGTPPYTYNWNTTDTTSTITNVAPGTFNVIVTDAAGCVINRSVVVDDTQPLDLTINSKNVTCNGFGNGEIAVEGKGGTAPYEYLWYDGSKVTSKANLLPGNYSVTVTDFYGCTFATSINITEPNVLSGYSSTNQTSCHGISDGSATVNVTGGTAPYSYLWSNGSTLQTATNLMAGTYNVTVIDKNGCVLNLNNIQVNQPNDITLPISLNQNYCLNEGKKVSDLIVSGSQIKWYRQAVGGTPINSNDLLISAMYYASQTIGSCESFGRTPVQVTIYNTIAPNADAIQKFCDRSSITINDLVVSGSNLKFYTQASGGTLIPSTQQLNNGDIVFVSQTQNGCESVNRTSIQIVNYNAQPIITNSLTICNVLTIQDISLDGISSNNLKWYTQQNGGIALSSTTVLYSGTFYVSTIAGGICESVRIPVQVLVYPSVPNPTTTPQSFCRPATVADLVVTTLPNATVNWYNTSQSVAPLALSTPLLNGTYYVEQVVGACHSQRVAVAVRVYSNVAPVMTDFSLCEGATVNDLLLASITNQKYAWFANNADQTPLKSTDLLTTGDYYVAFDNGACFSDKKKVHVTIFNRPNSPIGNPNQVIKNGGTTSDIKMNVNDVVWFDSYDNAMNRVNPIPKNKKLEDSKTYYGVIIDAEGCPSLPTPITISIDLSIGETVLEGLKYYPNPIDSELTISYVDTIKQVIVYSTLGQKIFSKEIDSQEVKLDLSHLSSGNYMLHVITNNGSQFIKVVKK